MFKKSLLVCISLSFSLSLTACGGSNTPTGTDMSSSSLSSGMTPISPVVTPVGDLSAGDAYDQTFEEPAAEAGATEEAPAEEVATDAAPTTEATTAPAMPADMEVAAPYAPASSTPGAASYAAEGSFKVDQDTFNQWQAVNISSDGSNIYVAATDSKMPSKGTVITMDATGASWKDIGKSFLSTITLGAAGYKMSKTITGVTVDTSGNVLVTDAQDRVFSMTTPKFSPKEVALSLSGATDVASAGDAYYVASSSGIQKIDSALGGATSFGSVSPSGGLSTDAQGNVYAVVGSSIKKIDATGKATDAVTGLSAPLDVALDSQGNFFVLESSSVVWFNAKGQKQGEFGSGEFQAPKAICTDSSGSVYVADAGTSHKDSVVVKYTASSGGGGLGDSSLDTL
jgi:carbon monoxide dehydrogenase subunit G